MPKDNQPKEEYVAPSKWKRFMYLGGVKRKELLFFTKNLLMLVKAGSTLNESLVILRNQSKGKMQIVLGDVCESVQKGYKFSDALLKYPNVFFDVYISMIKIGEESGTLEVNLEHLADQIDKSYQMRKKVIGAMIYPAIVVILAVVLMFGITLFVLPKVTRIFKNFRVELPWTTKALIVIGDVSQDYGVYIAIGLIMLGIFAFWLLRKKFMHPITHFAILNIPVVKSIASNSNMALFCRTMGMLLKGGVTIDEAMLICVDTAPNHYYKKCFAEAYTDIKGGESLGTVLAENKKLFSETDIQIIHVGEESGSLADSLSYCSSVHEAEVDATTKNLSTVLEPILLIFIGLMVGVLALSIITPIYSISNVF